MKKYTILLVMSLFLFIGVKVQYVIDFSNPATYHTTCGKVTAAQWTAKDQCELHLPPMILIGTSNLQIEYIIRINQSGNLENTDEFLVMYKINENGSWQTDSIIFGDNTNNVRTVHDSISITAADTIFFKFQAISNDNNEFWAIKNGDIQFDNVIPIYFPLPIELLSFDAEYNEDLETVDINWVTMTETNNDYFTIERSYNGIDFEPVVIIKGAGNSNSQLYYEYSDIKEIDQLTYYRLRQTDFDGKTTVSDPVAVQTNSNSSAPEIAGIYAQNGDLTMNIYIPEFQNIAIEIIDITGRTIIYDNMSLDAGSHVINYSTADLKGNMVFVRILNEFSDRISQKILIHS